MCHCVGVIVVGGGAVGIEMAGEVAGKHSGKFVTVIGAGKHLVTMNYGHKFQRKILSALRDRNINAITGKHGVLSWNEFIIFGLDRLLYLSLQMSAYQTWKVWHVTGISTKMF